MTASSRWTLSRPSLGTALAWSFFPALAAACGVGNDVDMGRLTLSGSGGAGGQGGPGVCGSQPCADHNGPRVFVEANASGKNVDGFDTATVHPPETDPSLEPAFLYPSHETMFPINVAGLRFTWSGVKDALFALDFKGPNTEVRVITAEPAWSPDEEEWDWIAESNRGGDVKVTVSQLAPNAPLDVWRSPPITLSFTREAVQGAIYYWSTASKGVMKALVSDQNAIKFYTDPKGADADADACTGCHTISRDGKRMAMGYTVGDVEKGFELREVSLPERQVLYPPNGGTAGGTDPKTGKMIPPAKAAPASWSTFSPDGKRLLVAAGGKLTLLDSDTGAPVGPDAGVVPLPPGKLATHPDWSALGDQIALTLAEKGGDKSTEGGSIALLPYTGGSFGKAEEIVKSQGAQDNNYFPSFSPDSHFIAYVNATGKSEDAKSASLRLIDVATRKVIELTRLNQRVNNQDGVLSVANSMPTWAPSTTPGIYWLAFSSVRQYADLRLPDKKRDQIWIAALDPSRADPSFAAFWAPFQSIDEGNHRAFWVPDEGRQCGCVEVCGDGVDNDCSGSTDEAGCVATCAEREICDDDIDNDCDCVVDDCSQEICEDGVDNDGDDRIDGDDPECAAR